MAEVTEQNDATGEAFQTEVNLDRYQRYGGSLFFPLDFIAKPISGYGGIMIFYNDYEADYLGGRLDQNQNFDILSTWEAPIVNFRVNDKFGNQFLQKGENRRSSADEERQRAQF